ncbi:MAG: xanthine dehydrogenase family protein molybdopterin-binding subunit, partial [Pseudomonadota bacterium]
MKFGVGQPLRRKEDDRFLRGEGRYVDDIGAPGQLHAQFLRSPAAHGRITSVDLDAARAAPGVRAVYAHADIDGRLFPLGNDFPMETPDGPPAAVTMPHLAADA